MASPGQRDEGLRRISRLTRWVAAGAIALVGILSGVAASAHPGRSAHASTATQPSSTTPAPAPAPSDSQPTNPAPSDSQPTDPAPSDPGLQAPAAPPAPSDSGGGAVSGGS